jgi:hypothetical protein
VAEARTEMMPIPAIALRTKTNATPSMMAMMRGSSEYYSLRATILDVGRRFLDPQCRVVDLACADGCWSEPLVQHLGCSQRFIALTNSPEDAEACLGRFRMCVRLGHVEVGQLDLNERFPDVASRLTISVNGLGRLKAERRSEVLGLVRKHLERKGAFLLVEKVETLDERLMALMPSHHGELSQMEETERFARAFSRRRLSAGQWEEELNEAGFDKVERVWSSGQYIAWLATKQ